MHDSSPSLSIGELAARSGVAVRTIRFYSDSGLVPASGRTDAGYRLFAPEALARIGLVRALRDLGVDLETIRLVLARELDLTSVATAHAAAIDAQIRVLKAQRAVLRTLAARGSDPEEMVRMNRLVQLSNDERRRILADFLDEAFSGLDIEAGFAARMRSATPELPDDPTPEQIDAWIELAELLSDADFRATIRRMSEQHAAARTAADGEQRGPRSGPDMRAAAAVVAQRGEAARAAGVAPGSPEAASALAEIAPAFAAPGEDPGDPAWRARLADRLATGTDPRAERYWQLLARINDWPPVPTLVPAWEWVIAALRGGPAGAGYR